jgi:hypothetical protein
LTFDRSLGTITLYTSSGTIVGSYPAANNAEIGSRGAWAPGTYSFAGSPNPRFHRDDSPDSSFGSWGNFVFNVPGCSGCGVHSGRATVPDLRGRTGPEHATRGCIRTTDEATRTIGEMHLFDPLTSITVK